MNCFIKNTPIVMPSIGASTTMWVSTQPSVDMMTYCGIPIIWLVNSIEMVMIPDQAVLPWKCFLAST